MKIYVDEDMASGILVRLLQKTLKVLRCRLPECPKSRKGLQPLV